MWMLHMICYCLILLTNLLPGPESELRLGWVIIALVGVIFLINFSNMMYFNLKKAFVDFRYWKLRRIIRKRLKKKAEMRQQALKEAVELAIVQADQQENLDPRNPGVKPSSFQEANSEPL